MKRITPLLAAALVLLGGSLGLATAPSAEARELTLRQAERGSGLKASVGDTIHIRLTEAPGLSWRYEGSRSPVVRLAGGRGAEEGRIIRGRGSVERQFTFEAAARGSETLTFVQVRDGRGRPGVVSTYRTTITVTGGHGPGAGHGPGHDHGKTVLVSEAADGSLVRVSRGDTLVVQLRGTARAGYHWDQVRANPGVLRAVGSGRVTRNRAGQTVTEFRYEAVGSGRAILSFKYHNERFRGPDRFARTVSFTADVPRGGFFGRR